MEETVVDENDAIEVEEAQEPMDFIELLLSMPKFDGIEFERSRELPREIDFE